MENKIIEVLKSIGLNKNEILIYLDLIQNNESGVLEISKRTKIHRTNIYDALRNLIEKGFVKQTIDKKRRIFSALNPKKIKDYLLQKNQEVEEIIPQIMKYCNQENSRENVYLSKGIFALRNILMSLLDYGEEIKVYGIPNNSNEILGEGFLKEFHKKRIKLKIPMRHIYNQDAKDRISRLNKMKYTYARHLSKQYDSHVATNICSDKVIIVVFSNPISIIEIKSSPIANAYSNYFEIIWNNSR